MAAKPRSSATDESAATAAFPPPSVGPREWALAEPAILIGLVHAIDPVRRGRFRPETRASAIAIFPPSSHLSAGGRADGTVAPYLDRLRAGTRLRRLGQQPQRTQHRRIGASRACRRTTPCACSARPACARLGAARWRRRRHRAGRCRTADAAQLDQAPRPARWHVGALVPSPNAASRCFSTPRRSGPSAPGTVSSALALGSYRRRRGAQPRRRPGETFSRELLARPAPSPTTATHRSRRHRTGAAAGGRSWRSGARTSA